MSDSEDLARARHELERAHAEMDSHSVPRTWGPNPDYAPDVPARIARVLNANAFRDIPRILETGHGADCAIDEKALGDLLERCRRRNVAFTRDQADQLAHPKELRRRVASAVIVRTEHGGAKKVLLTMRDGRSDFPNRWECPGGKVESGESDVEALMRELQEELDVYSVLVDRKPLGSVNLDPPLVKKPLVVTFYLVDVAPDNEPRALQSRCLAWFEPEALDCLPLMPANKALCDKVKAACGMLVPGVLPRTVEDALSDAADIVGRAPIPGIEV